MLLLFFPFQVKVWFPPGCLGDFKWIIFCPRLLKIEIVISSSNSTEVYNNTIKENAGYGFAATNSKLLDFKGNTIEDNDGGVKYTNCDYCNLTFNKIDENGGYGLWLLSGSNNNTIKHNTIAESSTKDVFLQGSTDNSAFNFTFSTISVDSSSKLTITANLAIVLSLIHI